jgi:hypothetical protein
MSDMGSCIGKLALSQGKQKQFNCNIHHSISSAAMYTRTPNILVLQTVSYISLFVIPDFSDVHMIVGHEREIFPAHKLILAARSDYFRKMFYGVQMKEAKESTCSFPDDDPIVFKAMLYHLYERPLEFVLDPRHIALCLVTSEKYRIGNSVIPYRFCIQLLYCRFIQEFLPQHT